MCWLCLNTLKIKFEESMYGCIVQVRSLRAPFGLVQTLPLRDTHLLLATEAGLVASSDYQVYRLLPVPIGVQVRSMDFFLYVLLYLAIFIWSIEKGEHTFGILHVLVH